MSDTRTYYIEVISSEEMYDGTHWQQTIENSPCLYHDEKGEASDVTHMVAALRAEVERLRKALRRAALTVACDYCGRSAGYPCQQFDRLIGCWWGERKPHAARVKAAERAEKEKEKANG